MKIAIASRDRKALDQIRAALDATEPRHAINATLGGLEQVRTAVETTRPEALILDQIGSAPEDMAALEALLHRPGAPVTLLLCAAPTADLLLAAMRSGVREVLPAPATPDALRDALARAVQRGIAGAPGSGRGQVLAFVSCKGGAGATFLATNLGYALAENRPVKVALFDLNLQAGDAALHVSDRPPATTLADVARNITRLDASYLAASLIPVLPNYGVLPAPGSPERALEVQPDHIDALLNEAVLHYDYVLIDANRILDGTVVRALDRATTIFAVLQLTVPAVRDAKRLLATFEALGYERDRIQLVVNRFERDSELGIKDVEKALDMPVAWSVPNSFRTVTSSVNQGIPVIKLAPKDPVSRMLQGMAAAVVKPRKSSGNWMKELLHLN